MKFIELEVRTAIIIHGYDDKNQEIKEVSNETEFIEKLISIERIQSISEQYILVTGSHGRVMYWEYNCEMAKLKDQLKVANLFIA